MGTITEKAVKVRFMKWDCVVEVLHYGNDRIALRLLEAPPTDDLSPIAVASVNLVSEPMGEDEVAIKDYSENEGMLDCLLGAGIVYPADRWAPSGYVLVPVCKLNLDRFTFIDGSLVYPK